MISITFAIKTNKRTPMHFVLSYDLQADDEKKQAIAGKIESILTPYKHVKRLHDFYIIQVQETEEWTSIRIALTNLFKETPEPLYFIMSPLMNEGIYNGILSTGDWNEINAITNFP
jgi:hypothetical protein